MKTFKLGEIELKNISCSDCLLSIGFEVESRACEKISVN